MAEVLRKSEERVRKFGEVFTPMWVVKKMCDMLGDENPEAWTVLNKTVLEPACGNGNFLVEIFECVAGISEAEVTSLTIFAATERERTGVRENEREGKAD